MWYDPDDGAHGDAEARRPEHKTQTSGHGNGHDGRRVAPLRERLPDRAAEWTCRRRRRG
jgi:hypothetical protein